MSKKSFYELRAEVREIIRNNQFKCNWIRKSIYAMGIFGSVQEAKANKQKFVKHLHKEVIAEQNITSGNVETYLGGSARVIGTVKTDSKFRDAESFSVRFVSQVYKRDW